MKRLIGLAIAFCVLLQGPCSAALLTPTGPTSSANADWFKTYSMEARVDRILKGNIAFVHNSASVWVYDHKEEMESAAVMQEDKTFSIPASFAKKMGCTGIEGAYVSSTAVAERLGPYTFVDERGLLIISSRAGVVNQTLVTGDDERYMDFYNISGVIGKITWQDVTPTEEDYKTYQQNRLDLLTYPKGKEETYAAYIKSGVQSGKNFVSRLDTSPKATSPFTDLTIRTEYCAEQYVQIETVYSRIVTMAKAYYMDENKDEALKNAIFYAMEFMYQKYYEPGGEFSGSVRWTTFTFSIPFHIGNILCLMYDEMTDEERLKYVNAVWDKQMDPVVNQGTGTTAKAHYHTNRMWTASAWFNCAMVVKDAARANYAMRYLNQCYEMVDKNSNLNMSANGYYEDGSMIFHANKPYNIGYGSSYISTQVDLYIATQDTCFDLNNIYGFSNTYRFIKDHYLPFVVRNKTMKMVLGRTTNDSASTLISSCMIMLHFAPEDVKYDISKVMKKTVGDYLNEYEAVTPTSRFGAYPIKREIIRDYLTYLEEIPESEYEGYNKVYYNMERIIHDRENYRFGLSLSSNRIAKYEGFKSGKGLTEWYIGDGMTYLYTSDRSQYGTSWWANADPYYMPGTTVDSTRRTTEITTEDKVKWGMPENEYSGGVSNGIIGTAGMILGNQWVSHLDVRKSWYMFDDEIVCLGSGITGGKGEVYTVVDNRMLGKTDTGAESNSEIKMLEIAGIEDYAGSEEEALMAVVDGDTDTNWRNSSIGSWITFDFGESVDIAGPSIMLESGSVRKAKMIFEVSDDNVNFTEVFNGMSSGSTENYEFYPVACKGRYFRITNLGNTASNWMTMPEIKFYAGGVDPETLLQAASRPAIGYEKFIIDGKEIPVDFDAGVQQVESPKWAWNEKNIGYVFLTEETLQYRREFTGPGFPFLITSLRHGTGPKDAGYAYVLLPDADQQKTMDYAANPKTEILSRTNQMHAVRHGGTVMANIFEISELEGILFQTPCQAMIEKTTTGYKVYVSDPNYKQNSISMKFRSPVTVSGNARLESDNTVVVDVGVRKGDTYTFEFSYTSDQTVQTTKYRYYTSGTAVSGALYVPEGTAALEVVQAPERGTFTLDGTSFRYVPAAGGAAVETVRVKAVGQDGAARYYELEFNRNGTGRG